MRMRKRSALHRLLSPVLPGCTEQMIDVVGELRIEIPDRIVRQRGEMHDGIEALEIGPGQVAEVFPNFGDAGRWLAEVAASVKVGIEADHFVPGGTQAWALPPRRCNPYDQ